MCIQPLSIPKELCPFHIWANLTTFHCSSSQHTPAARRKAKPNTMIIKPWPEGALFQLQEHFVHTVWDLFEHQELKICTDCTFFTSQTILILCKYIRVFANQKPWKTRNIQTLLRTHDTAFRMGGRTLYNAAGANLKRGIKDAKRACMRRI